MKQEDKELLQKDLCVRLPYGVKVEIIKNNHLGTYTLYPSDIDSFKHSFQDIKPYLRPMSSMTEEEKDEWEWMNPIPDGSYPIGERLEMFDWLNAHHFDYRGLIEKGLALPAPEDMYNEIKEEKK